METDDFFAGFESPFFLWALMLFTSEFFTPNLFLLPPDDFFDAAFFVAVFFAVAFFGAVRFDAAFLAAVLFVAVRFVAVFFVAVFFVADFFEADFFVAPFFVAVRFVAAFFAVLFLAAALFVVAIVCFNHNFCNAHACCILFNKKWVNHPSLKQVLQSMQWWYSLCIPCSLFAYEIWCGSHTATSLR